MSNLFNKTTPMLKRPKVCHSKPPVDAPKPDETCDVDPDAFDVSELGGGIARCKSNDPDKPPSEDVFLDFVGEGDFLFLSGLIANDNTFIDEEVIGFSPPGQYQTTITFTHSGGLFCEKNVTITIP